MNGKTTSWIVTGVGAVVTGIGYVTGGMIGAGIMGFGPAHVVLGVLVRVQAQCAELKK